jgi:hypothetical protein
MPSKSQVSVNVPDRDYVAQQLVNAGVSQSHVGKVYSGISRTSIIGARGQKAANPHMTFVFLKGDMTGSMWYHRSAYVETINQFATAMRGSADEGTIMLSKTHFNSRNYLRSVFHPDPNDPNDKPDPLILVHAAIPLEDVEPMTEADYEPGHFTPLFDSDIAWYAQITAYVESQLSEGVPIRRVIAIELGDGLEEEDQSGDYYPYQFREPEDVKPILMSLRDSGLYVPVFIGFGHGFKKVAVAMGYDPDNVRETGGQDESELRKLMQLASQQSVSASKGKIGPGNKFFQTN